MSGLLRLLMQPNDGLYNCSLSDSEQWLTKNPQQYYIGALYCIISVICQILYIPCLIVMLRTTLTQHSCFKIMFILGINDLICLYFGGNLAGIFSIMGYTYCSNPKLLFVVGSLGLGAWASNSGFFVILTLDRFLDLYFPSLNIFKGKATGYWCLLPVLYASYYALFERPMLYDANYHAFFSDPHISGQQNVKEFSCVALLINNITLATLLTFFHTAICIRLVQLSRRRTAIQTIRIQKMVTIQAAVFCLFNTVGCFIYVAMQYNVISVWFTVLGELCWIACHGSIPIMYLTLNRTMRANVLGLVSGYSMSGSLRLPRISIETKESQCRRNQEETIHFTDASKS